MKLTQDLVELISDDFQSTFFLSSPTTLSNMMGPSDFDEVASIIKKHCNCDVTFTKTNTFETPYDIYVVTLKEEK
jgi:hypothetical protein